MNAEDMQEVKEAAELVLKTCEKIKRLESYIEDMKDVPGMRVSALVSGFSSESYNDGRIYLDLGEPHKKWVIQRLHHMVEEQKFAITEIHPFYKRDPADDL